MWEERGVATGLLWLLSTGNWMSLKYTAVLTMYETVSKVLVGYI